MPERGVDPSVSELGHNSSPREGVMPQIYNDAAHQLTISSAANNAATDTGLAGLRIIAVGSADSLQTPSVSVRIGVTATYWLEAGQYLVTCVNGKAELPFDYKTDTEAHYTWGESGGLIYLQISKDIQDTPPIQKQVRTLALKKKS